MSTKKTFTPDEAAQIAVEYGRMRVNQIAKSLQELRDRELKKAIIKPHANHSTGTTSGSGTEDVPPSKINPPGKNDALKTEETPGEKHGRGEESSASALCKMCGKSHSMEKGCDGMGKSMLKDAKGKEKDNGIVPGSVLPEDKKTEEMSHDGSGGDITKGKKLGKSLADLHKAAVLSKPAVSEAQRRAMGAAAGGDSTLGIPKSVGKEFIDADKGGKLPEVKKAATPPMAMPPSGKNMNTHVPTSKPAGAMAKEVKEMVVHGSKAVAPPKGADYEAKQKGDKAVYVAKEELAGDAMAKAGLAATQPARPGIFGRLGGGTKTLVPPPGIKTAGAGLHPAGGGLPGQKPAMTAMSATHQPPKTEVSLGSTQGGAPSLAAPTAPNNMPKSPMAAPAKPVASKGPNALGSIIGAPPIVAPASTKSLAPAPALKPAGMALEPAGAPPMKQLAPAPSKNAVAVNSKPKP